MSKQGYVYAVQAVPDGPVKFGFSTAPRSRIKSLRMGSPVPLRFVLVVFDTKALENAIHWRLRGAGSWLHGEWYRPTGVTVTVLDELRVRNVGVERDGRLHLSASPAPKAVPCVDGRVSCVCGQRLKPGFPYHNHWRSCAVAGLSMGLNRPAVTRR